ncbi:MAG: response regulator [Lentisphaerae bacterium]|nr:response regulator [Lentisphaerota bacterium]
MILVVDDDLRLAATLRTVLEHEGESVITAANGVEAYGVLKSQSCSMMLMDVNMPALSGTELLKLMKDEDISVPTIVMTGNEAFDPASLKNYSFVIGLERKPFDIVKLASTIHGYGGRQQGVTVFTATRRIDGDLTLPAAVDLPAFVSQSGPFIVLNNASVTHGDGSAFQVPSALCLRVDSIVCLSAVETAPAEKGTEHGSD